MIRRYVPGGLNPDNVRLMVGFPLSVSDPVTFRMSFVVGVKANLFVLPVDAVRLPTSVPLQFMLWLAALFITKPPTALASSVPPAREMTEEFVIEEVAPICSTPLEMVVVPV